VQLWKKKSTAPNAFAWISQHKDKPISVQTAKGTCSIWDQDWKIKGMWDLDNQEFNLINVAQDQHDYTLIIDETGDVTLRA